MYRFGLAVTVGEEESEVVGQRSSVMTSIDTDVIFSPPNLQLEVASHMAEVCSVGFMNICHKQNCRMCTSCISESSS